MVLSMSCLHCYSESLYFIMSTYDTIPFRFFHSPELVNVPKEEALEEIEDKRLSIVKD